MSAVEMCEEPEAFQESQDDPDTDGSKLDIGEFVITFRKIKKLTEPIASFHQTVLHMTRWSSPITSFVCAAVCCWICITFPGYLLLVPLLYVSLLLGINGVRKICTKKRGEAWSKYQNVAKKSDTFQMELKQAAVNQAHEDLRKFINIVIMIQLLSDQICQHMENIYRLFMWDDPKYTVKCFTAFVTGLFLLLLLPGGYLAAVCVLVVFAANAEFQKVFRETVGSLSEGYMQPSVNRISGTWRWLRRWSSTVFSFSGNGIEAEKEDEWFDAENEMSSSCTTSEGEDGSGFGENTPSKSRRHRLFTVDYKSMVSQLADYRKKKKTLKSGTCASCNMSFSGLLKKRQYCRHCGDSFCSRCCSQRVTRAVFGATAPAAYEETVLVCKSCYGSLMSTTSGETSEFW